MKKIYKSGLFVVVLLLLGSCSDDNNNDAGAGNVVTSKAGSLKQASNVELEEYIKKMMLEAYGKARRFPYIIDGAIPESDGDALSTSKVSTTNLQESNVDEADRIKTDGQYIYTAALSKAAIRTFKPNKESVSLVNELVLGGDNERLSGLYLYNQKLVALSQQQDFNMWERWFAPESWANKQNQVYIVNADNPENPSQQTKLTLDGHLISSRRIGSTLYAATRHSPSLSGLNKYPFTEAEAEKNRNLINNATLQDFLPDYQLDTDGTSSEIFSADNCFLTDYSDKNNRQVSIISMIAINLDDATPQPRGKCFVGDAETLYASINAVYLATTSYNYNTDDSGGDMVVYSNTVNTDLHKFSLANGEINYVGSGSVSGHLGWKQDLKPFRMSEHNDVLRIITYTGEEQTSNSSPAHLYTLQANTTSQALDILGELPNDQRQAPLGKPGEQIYATRFMGDRGYLVTFRMTDPLYILDLTDPADPFIAGELQIEGYSDYLHPINENILLGVGKDAIADNGSSMGDGRGAWYQGVKLSTIDISDPANPFEKDKIIIGKRGTETAVNSTHHALTSLVQNNTTQIALPISLHGTNETNPYNDPSYYYQWDNNQLYRLNIDTQGNMQTLPSMVARTSESWQWQQDRSVMIGDYVYYLSEDEMFGREW